MKILQDRILDSKEQLSVIQKELLHRGGTVVSVTINAPSYFKDAFYIEYLLEDACNHIKEVFKEEVLYIRTVELEFGYASLFVINNDPYSVKEKMIVIEESSNYSRLYDIDVFENEVTLMSRRDLGLPPRVCWICDEVAHECVRSRKHDFAEVFIAYQRMIDSFMEKRYPKIARVVGYAIESIFLEVYTTPKPGLVDRLDNGSHDDMDFDSFMRSLNAISLYLYEFAELGYLHKEDLDTLFPQLRELGKTAEKAMYEATDGVNTHKGIIFLMGVTLGVIGYLCPNMELDEVIKNIQYMTRNILNELGDSGDTHGERVYKSYQVTGIRGEVVEGFPNVLNALEVFTRVRDELSLNDALLHTLLILISTTEDTTILHRRDYETLEYVQQKVRAIIINGGLFAIDGKESLVELNNNLKEIHVSPGGSADLLAMTYFFSKLLNNK